MNRNRGKADEPRGRTTTAERQSSTPAIPEEVLAGGPSVAWAWAMQQAGVQPEPGEIDEDAFRLIDVTRADVRALVDTWIFSPMFGPPQGYKGGTFIDALPDGHEAVRAAMTALRCTRYEAQLQDRAPSLQRAVQAAQKAADEGAWSLVAADWERYRLQVQALANDPRRQGDISAAIRPPRVEPDLTEVRKAQARVDRLAGEIGAVRRRGQASSNAAGAIFGRIAEACARLLWIGPQPGSIPERPDWSEMYQSYDVLAEILGKDKADELLATAVERWKR